jgi:Holliday junction resolvasome RuvABC endonuclease subunit
VLVTPQQAKRAVGVSSRASKRGVGDMVSRLPGSPARLSQHAADAVAVALAGRVRARTS